MKILHLGKFYPPDAGGIETVVATINKELNTLGIQSDVLCAKKPGKIYKDDIRPAKPNTIASTIHRANTIALIASTAISPDMILKLYQLRNDYDIIHLHFPDPMAIIALFITRPKAHLIIHWHSDVVRQKIALKFFSPFIYWAINRAKLIIGATKVHIEESDFSKMFKKKGVVLPLSLDTKDIGFRQIYPKHNIKILAIGRLVSYKGFEFLIKAISMLDERFSLEIIGDGELRSTLQRQIEDLHIRDRAKLLGELDNESLKKHLSECHIFCLPSISRSEMFGVVQLEAMQHSKPVVSTDIPRSGVPYVNINNKTGIIVKPKDSASLRDAFVELANNKELYDRLSRGAYEESLKYNNRELTLKLIELYRNIMAD